MTTRNTMKAGVHGNIHFVAYEVAYAPDEALNPRCTPELFQRTFGLNITMPSTTPQPLMKLLSESRSVANDDEILDGNFFEDLGAGTHFNPADFL